MVVVSVPWMIGMRGADALNTCFNAVALAFVVEVDNFCYDLALSDETKADFEKKCRLTITAEDSVLLARTKSLYLVLTPLGIFFCLAGYATANMMAGYSILIYGFAFVAQIGELIVGASLEPRVGRACCSAVVKMLLGCFVIYLSQMLVTL